MNHLLLKRLFRMLSSDDFQPMWHAPFLEYDAQVLFIVNWNAWMILITEKTPSVPVKAGTLTLGKA